jgi:hypothetical protein
MQQHPSKLEKFRSASPNASSVFSFNGQEPPAVPLRLAVRGMPDRVLLGGLCQFPSQPPNEIPKYFTPFGLLTALLPLFMNNPG